MSSLPAYLLFLLLTDKTKHTGDLAKGTQFEKRLSLPDTGGGAGGWSDFQAPNGESDEMSLSFCLNAIFSLFIISEGMWEGRSYLNFLRSWAG